MYRFTLLAALGLAVGLTGCDSLLDDPAPETSTSPNLAFENESAVRANLVGAYSTVQGYWDIGTIFADVAAETARHSGSYPTWRQVDTHTYTSENVTIAEQWTGNYDLINTVNFIIQETPNVDDNQFTEAERADVIAQALTLRAFAYHNLLRWYGVRDGLGVPIVLEPTAEFEDAVDIARAPTSEVYAQIYADYERAVSLFEQAGGGASVGFIDADVAKALWARALLYDRQYEEAGELAAEVAQNYSLSSLDGVYESLNSQESVWELQYNPDDTNSMSFFAYRSGLGGRYEYAPEVSFYNEVAATPDARFEYLFTVQQNNAVVGKYFRVNTDDDHHFMVRLPELLFIQAEAAAARGDYATAVDLVNQVRARAFDEDAEGANLDDFLYSSDDVNSFEEALDIILAERRLELAFEGHRWHDLVRTGRAIDVLPTLSNESRTRWPIPQGELDVNQLLEQNPQY